jgi:hypothetical protein
MTTSLKKLNNEVSDFLDQQNHILRKEIDRLRICILSTNENLVENIKWNAPNYSFNEVDCITMKIQPPTSKQIQLIFHRGAKKQEQPKNKLIEVQSNLLIWKENDRAIASFKTITEIETAEFELKEIIKKWIQAI